MLPLLGSSFLMLLVIGLPIPVAILGSSLFTLWLSASAPMTLVPQQMFLGADSFPLLAVPFFILAGKLMHVGGCTRRLVALAQALVGHMRASLGMISIVAAMFFAGISGSAVADTSAVGGVMAPAMIAQGYKRGLVACLLASAGAIGPIIPPSIIMIVYGSITHLSIGALFLGGFIPGVLIGLALMAITFLYSLKYKEMAIGTYTPWAGVWKQAGGASLALLLPVLVVGGILRGVFTATEAGVVAVLYALVLSLFVYRELPISSLKSAFIETGETTGVVMLLLVASMSSGWILSQNRFDEWAINFIKSLSFGNSHLVLALVIAFLLILGCFLEVMAAAIMLAPTLQTLCVQMGWDPIHFGVVVVVTLMIGAVTPPVGILLFLGCRIVDITLEEAWKFVYPFVFAMIVVTYLCAYVPGLVVFLPNLFFK